MQINIKHMVQTTLTLAIFEQVQMQKLKAEDLHFVYVYYYDL